MNGSLVVGNVIFWPYTHHAYRSGAGVVDWCNWSWRKRVAEYWKPSLHHHWRLFGKAPRELSGGHGLYSPENETEARRLSVRRVSLPKPGYKSPKRKRRERQAWFRAAQRFRNGIEGRISQLRRARMFHRGFNHGWASIANSLFRKSRASQA